MPDRDRVVVSNTTPIIALALIKNLDLLQRLYGEVVIPPAVHEEISAGGAGRVGVIELRDASYIKMGALSDPDRAALISDLDRGEAEVIALAQELDADLVIIDERLARWHARRLGLNVTGVLGVLLKAKDRGFVKEVKPLIDDLRRGGIWLSDELVSETLRLAAEQE